MLKTFFHITIGTAVKRYLVAGLFCLPVYLFLTLNLPISASSIRGEHWMLLYRYVEDAPLSAKIRNIALFAFSGIGHAFFAP